MSKIRPIIILLVLSLSLSGCFGGTTLTGQQTYTTSEFSIAYPDGWIIKTPQDFGNNIPISAVATFSDPVPRDGYQSTVSIVTDVLPPEISSLEYSQANINNAITNVIDFQKISEIDLTLGEVKTKLIVFTGKSSLESKNLKYIQTYLVKGTIGYTLTASSLLDISENDFKMLQDILTSFRFQTETETVTK